MPDHVMHKGLSQEKAKEILEHGEVHGKKLTKKQRGFFGARASGATVPPKIKRGKK